LRFSGLFAIQIFSARIWGRLRKKEHLERFKPYKVRPATNVSPESWETGTQVHELIAGIGAAVDYIAELGRKCDARAQTRREALASAYAATVRMSGRC